MKILMICMLFIMLFLTSCDGSIRLERSIGGEISIHDIQGCSHVSPWNGNQVTGIEGVVTWKLENGFFMQERYPDSKDCSSEGIFVFTNDYPSAIPGDLVTVDGRVKEFTPGSSDDGNLSITEIDADNVQVIGMNYEFPSAEIIGSNGRIPPNKIIDDDKMVRFEVTTDGLDFFESLEGMRVQVNEAVVVESTNTYNEVFVIPTDLANDNVLSLTGALLQTESDNNPERILIQLPDGYNKYVFMGDTLSTPIIGIMGYEYGNYRIIAINNPTFEVANASQDVFLQEIEDSQIRLVSYNINNFNRFDEEKVSDIAAQVVYDLGLPDILVLQEIQDDSGLDDDGITSASQNLDTLANVILEISSVQYTYLDQKPVNNTSGGASGANIRTIMLFREDRGLTLGKNQCDFSIPNSSSFYNSRKPIVCEFSRNGKSLFVIGVHLVSNNLNSPLFGAFQPIQEPEESKRFAQANAIADFVEKINLVYPYSSIIIAGDFNDVPWSSAIEQLEKSNIVNTSFAIEENERYSIIYEGNANIFDQIFVSEDILDQISSVQILHLNTTEPEDKQISDHDPVIADLQF